MSVFRLKRIDIIFITRRDDWLETYGLLIIDNLQMNT